MNYLIKPLTKKMLTQLRVSANIELSKTEKKFCTVDDFQNALPKLYNRGFIDIKMVTVDGKEIVCMYITTLGMDYLNKHQEDPKKPGSKYHLN
jgi:hypothetical protein